MPGTQKHLLDDFDPLEKGFGLFSFPEDILLADLDF
jgi:hypothetical protein